MHKITPILFVVCGFILSGCVGPESLIRTHAYSPPKKSQTELATIFGAWNGAGGEQTFICKVDGKSYHQIGAISNCPSVVYVPEGNHEIQISYRYANYQSDKAISASVKSGRTYQVTSTGNIALKVASFAINEMPESFKLRYKDLVPMLKEKYNEKGEQLVLPSDAE